MLRKPGVKPGARTWAMVGTLTAVFTVLVLVFISGRSRSQDGRGFADALPRSRRPDELPLMLNREASFRYPAPLYAQKVQGNVTLRIFVDRDGRVRPESTRVEESSGYTSLDSSAVTGSQDLRFVPAKLNGEPIAVSILLPVFFRHPEATPLPGDSVLKRH